MAKYAIDASTALAFLLNEPFEGVVDFFGVISATDDLVAAQVFLPECTSVLRQRVAWGDLESGDAQRALRALLNMPIRICADRTQFSRSFELATRLNRGKAYDMQYVATAEIEDAELVTIDGGMRQAALQLNRPVRFLR